MLWGLWNGTTQHCGPAIKPPSQYKNLCHDTATITIYVTVQMWIDSRIYCMYNDSIIVVYTACRIVVYTACRIVVYAACIIVVYTACIIVVYTACTIVVYTACRICNYFMKLFYIIKIEHILEHDLLFSTCHNIMLIFCITCITNILYFWILL